MKIKIWFLFLLVPFFASCSTIKGSTVKDQRQYVLDMGENTLKKLYSEKPVAKTQIKEAAGYGVFSNIGTNLFLLSTGNGYGVVKDIKAKKITYMKMYSAGLGIGLGIKDFRAVIIFRKHDDLKRFVEKGWEFHGQVDVAAKSGDKGMADSSAQSTNLDIITYQITESGIALQATLQGTKYWKHPDLN